MPGWATRDQKTKIEARFRFKDFRSALDFVRQVGELAETAFHHPVSIIFGWGVATVVLQTKKIKGLHENDFIMAARSMKLPNGSRAGSGINGAEADLKT